MSNETVLTQTPSTTRFTSRLGFYLAAVGSAVGVGNIWGFPTQAADNGGAAFVLVYLCFSFLLAWPMLIAELLIGRYGRSDAVTTLESVSNNHWSRQIGRCTGWLSITTVLLIYTFYAIIAGWIISFGLIPVAEFLGADQLAVRLGSFDLLVTGINAAVFMIMTAVIVSGGVANGIEKWCGRLMPILFLMLLGLIAFTLQQEGAMAGLQYFLQPDFNKILDTDLLISALGQSFFSMSLGVGIMVVYGSYLTSNSNVPTIAAGVAVTDTLIAVMAGLLIIPGMFVAQQHGIEIHTASGTLKSADTLVFDVLPTLFNQFEIAGPLLFLTFFALLTITALTSAISILEVPVASLSHRKIATRSRAVWLITIGTFLATVIVLLNKDLLFGFIISLTTRYSMPLLSLVVCLYAGWIWSRDKKLKELSKGYPDVGSSLFWKIWPWYVRYVCPSMVLLLIALTF